MIRGLAWIAGLLIVLWAPAGHLAVVSPPQQSSPRGLINQYCVSCHNDRLKTGGLALDTLDIDKIPANAEIWEKVVRRINARSMPPAGRTRPDDSSYNALVSYLESSLDRAAAARPNPGRTDTFRRLNRTEYQNAIRDLLALDVDVTSLLPRDDANHGFDNVGIVTLPASLMERYLSAAQKISRLAIGSSMTSPGFETVLMPPELTQDSHFDGLPFGSRGGTAMQHNFPLDGEYEIQIRLTRDRNEQIEGLSEPHEMEIALDGRQVQHFTLQPQPRGAYARQSDYYNPELGDAGLKTRVAVKAGPHELGVTFLKRPSALVETERRPYDASFNHFFHPRTQPALYSISITGPYNPSGIGETPSRQRIFVCRPETPSAHADCAAKIISTLARRAYRRPVTDADVRVPLTVYEDTQATEGFEAGIEMALRAILVNPEFLFRIERDPRGIASNVAYRISDVELATRLSLFLWNSIPDDQLLEKAVSGQLRDSAVLEQQVRRMLSDVRSEALVKNFAGQWLHLRNLAAVTPDPRTFPDFDENLRQAFRLETELFFDSIVKEDRSVLDLLNANYTFVNERLARHYDIPNVYGSRFRRVTLDANSVRGGLFGHGSILTVTSYATRTSPVLRGKWLLENILGTPPPPPPGNVPPLKENAGEMKVLSMRKRMAEHRSNPTCASCHELMDPAGLSMENFDATGRWRERDEGGNAIDASGSLPDSVKFEGVAGLRLSLLKRPELFVTTLTEKMLTYALGRPTEYYDAPAVRRIVQEARDNNYRFSSVIMGVIHSTPFEMRNSQ